MTYLVDANVLSEATKPDPVRRVLNWLREHERELVVDPIVLGEIRFGILLLAAGKRRRRLERWFASGVPLIAGFIVATVATLPRGQPQQRVFAGQFVVTAPPVHDEKFTDAVTLPRNPESKRLIQAAQDYIKRKDWRIAAECLQSLLET